MKHSFLVIILISLPILYCGEVYSSTAPTPLKSSCGHITDIRCPFHLQGDHQKCDLFSYELTCNNNNRTILMCNDTPYPYSKSTPKSYYRYYVEDINYDMHSIRVVDQSVDKNKDNDSCSSLPIYPFAFFPSYLFEFRELNTPLTFLDCSVPAISSRYIRTPPCSLKSSVNNSYYSYVVVGDLDWSELEERCMIREMTWVSSQWQPIKNSTTFPDIHENAMLHYGFDIPWTYLSCLNCRAKDGFYCSNYSCYSSSLVDYFIYDTQFAFEMFQMTTLLCMVRFLCGMPLVLSVIVYKSRRRHLSASNTIEDFLQAQTNLMPIRYNYAQIKTITNNFKDILGVGGFGTVYKGKLRSGLLVAVKFLDSSKSSGQEFINEVSTIGRIHHVNVVRLVGFCFEGSKRALIYEFMPNGSLEKFIFPLEEDEGMTTTLSCQKVYEISFKVAAGIEYLHRGCDMQILHFDIKPHNILLDEHFNPKISDFGLAKLYATGDSIVTLTAARGTMGYMAPELFYKNIGGVSYKADVYSFGMLLMEMAGRRKNLNPFVENTSQIYFPSWIYDQFKEGKEIEMEDASAEEKKLVKKMVIVALWCIQMKPGDRPSMNKVIEMLEGDVENLMMPPKPFICPEEIRTEDRGVE